MREWRKLFSVILIGTIILTLFSLGGCTPRRADMADIVRYYGEDAPMGAILEWTGITAYDDKEIKEISHDFASLAKGILIYVPSYGLMGALAGPKALWNGILIVVDTRDPSISDKDFARALASFGKKWMHINPSVGEEKERVYIEFMDTRLYIYTIGGMKVLTGNSSLQKRSQSSQTLSRFLDNMLSLQGDYRAGFFYGEQFGVFSFTGGSKEVLGKIYFDSDADVFLTPHMLPAYMPEPIDKVEGFGVADGYIIDSIYKMVAGMAGGLIKSVDIPHNSALSVVVPSHGVPMLAYTGKAEDFFRAISFERGRDISYEKKDIDGGITLYYTEGDVLPYKDGVLYAFLSGSTTEDAIKAFFTDENRRNGETYKDILDGNDIHLVGFLRIPSGDEEFPSEIRVKVVGKDVLSVGITLDRAVDLKKVIFKYFSQLRRLTVESRGKEMVNRAKAILPFIGFTVARYYEEHGVFPHGKEELLSLLDNGYLKEKWFGEESIGDVIAEEGIYSSSGYLCLPVPTEYVKYAGGKYLKIDFVKFVSGDKMLDPMSGISSVNTCGGK